VVRSIATDGVAWCGVLLQTRGVVRPIATGGVAWCGLLLQAAWRDAAYCYRRRGVMRPIATDGVAWSVRRTEPS